jgi:hypothetical protein
MAELTSATRPCYTTIRDSTSGSKLNALLTSRETLSRQGLAHPRKR